MRHQAEGGHCLCEEQTSGVGGAWEVGCRSQGWSRAATWSGFRSAAAGCARSGHLGGNSLEGETRVEAGAMGGLGYRVQMPLRDGQMSVDERAQPWA